MGAKQSAISSKLFGSSPTDILSSNSKRKIVHNGKAIDELPINQHQIVFVSNGRFDQDNLIVIGDNNIITGTFCIVIGNHNICMGSMYTQVFGHHNTLTGIYVEFVGNFTTIDGVQVSGYGNNCTLRGSSITLFGSGSIQSVGSTIDKIDDKSVDTMSLIENGLHAIKIRQIIDENPFDTCAVDNGSRQSAWEFVHNLYQPHDNGYDNIQQQQVSGVSNEDENENENENENATMKDKKDDVSVNLSTTPLPATKDKDKDQTISPIPSEKCTSQTSSPLEELLISKVNNKNKNRTRRPSSSSSSSLSDNKNEFSPSALALAIDRKKTKKVSRKNKNKKLKLLSSRDKLNDLKLSHNAHTIVD